MLVVVAIDGGSGDARGSAEDTGVGCGGGCSGRR